jgi:predicted acyl esterase
MDKSGFPGIPAFSETSPQFTLVKETMNDGTVVDVIYRKGSPGKTREEMDALRARGERVDDFSYCAPLNPRTYEAAPGIICLQDECVTLRDGVKIYADIYLPKNAGEPVPLIVCWWFSGKRQSEGAEEWAFQGCPPDTVSKLAKFESADPAYWCRMGYAVANVDPRGVGNSEGDISSFGLQDGRDGYDFIEWAARQDWCDGNVGMFGNSGVAMVIWRIAAEQPPHLKCIAVWEGTGDMYRESLACGGIPSPYFNNLSLNGVACSGYIEDMPNMLIHHPYMDAYWKSKIPRWANITQPAYVAAGWCHFHVRGSFEGFRKIKSQKKWMRAHREMEWPDAYHPENIQDLHRFFDRYLKDIRNGWEFTPPVRLEVMDAYSFDFVSNRAEKEFPLARTQYRKLYLDAKSGSARFEPFAEPSEMVYDPDADIASFDFVAQEDMEITGYMKLRLYVECRGHDNMDLFVWIKKYGLDGEYIPLHCMEQEYRGAWGYMRTSRRELDPELSTDYNPVQAHRKDELMEPGKVYPVDIEIWPHSRVWHKGEHLRIEISGRFIKTDWSMDHAVGFVTDNGGRHVIHTGGQYASFLQIPVIPPRYRSGDYIVH